MDVFYGYTFGTAAWMGLQSLPLLISPTMIVTMLAPQPKTPTRKSHSCTLVAAQDSDRLTESLKALETYLSRTLALALLTIAFLNILLTGSVPLTSSLVQPSSLSSSDPRAPYALPTLTISTIFQAASAIYCYVWWQKNGGLALVVGIAVNTIFASVGLWCILFASSGGKISRKTGADKRTSSYPFKNSVTASEKKKKSSKKET